MKEKKPKRIKSREKILVKCPNKHTICTSYRINIQCWKCGIRFNVKEPLEPVLAEIAKGFINK